MNDGLKDAYREAILDELSNHPRIERVVLFGSRAMGSFTQTSDVDLVLFGDKLTLTDQARLSQKISELPIPQRIDLLLHHRVKNQKLLAHIEKHGVEWYCRKRTEASEAAEADGESSG